MTQKTLLKKVSEVKALEAQKKALEKRIEALQGEIKTEMEARGTEETEVGDFTVLTKPFFQAIPVSVK